MKFARTFLRNIVLRNFLQINLSSVEREIALEAIDKKYARSVTNTIISALLVIPAILFLDTGVIISVLIPVTMVAGTAWFSVSLASVRKKFENFGLELTTNLFNAFAISLAVLVLLTIASLTEGFWADAIATLPSLWIWELASAVLGILVVGNIIYQIFLGSLKYDINDAMLTGQNEAAERFYKKALSLLHSTADSLRDAKNSIQVANYLLGVSFFEVFSHIKLVTGNPSMEQYIEKANKLIFNPSMSQEEADKIALELIRTFLDLCVVTEEIKQHKPYRAVSDEYTCLKNNTNEDQAMVDTRISVALEEIANLMEEYGEQLFVKKK